LKEKDLKWLLNLSPSQGILKYEFGLIKIIPTIEVAQKMVAQAITIYNNERRHCSLQMKTPAFAHSYQKHEYKSYKKLVA